MGTITTPKAYQGPSRVADPYTGGVFTKHGWFSYGELDANEAKYTTDRNGRQVVQFPFSREAAGRPMYREIPAWVLREQDEREQREEPDRAAD
jgi:hypothetical protein